MSCHRKFNRWVTGGLTICGAVLWAVMAAADVSITLKNGFIEQHKNRATMDATYSVTKTHHRAKSAKEDGDIHCAGLADEIGLACVTIRLMQFYGMR